MLRTRWRKIFVFFEFWLPLPLLGLGFWLVSDWVTDQNLSQSDKMNAELQVSEDTSGRSPAAQVLSIKVQIDRDRGVSQVIVKQAVRDFQRQEFQLPATDFAQLETAIARELGLTTQQVRQLIRYRIEPQAE